jgi:ABC-type glutathione transport system ATPase component
MNTMENRLIQVEKLYKEFPFNSGLLEQFTFEGSRIVRSRESVKAINGIDLEVVKGEALCLVALTLSRLRTIRLPSKDNCSSNPLLNGNSL